MDTPGLGQLFHVNDDCTGVNWSVLVLVACCQRGWGNKFQGSPRCQPLTEGLSSGGGEARGQGGLRRGEDSAGSPAPAP